MSVSSNYYHSTGHRVKETSYNSYSSSSSESDDDYRTSITKDWEKAISVAKLAADHFDLYPWNDAPKTVKGKECVRRVKWLSTQEGYPFNDHPLSFSLSDESAIQLLYLFHKVKNNISFDENDFCKGSGDIRSLQARVQGESCTLI